MLCVCVDIAVEAENALCLCEMDTQPISATQSDLIADYASQLLIGIGKIIANHPEINSQMDARTGERLITLGQKLQKQVVR